MTNKQSLIVDIAKGDSLVKINPNLQHVSSAKASWQGIQVGHYRQLATFGTPGDMLMTFISWTGTHQGQFMATPATGQRVTIRTADLFRIENQQLVEHWDVVENMSMMAQIGAIRFVNAE
jgi:hypothetical protein